MIMKTRQRLREEKGAIALLTLAFLIFAGLLSLFILWGIARVTGAYNLMYASNQSAAYAAATAVDSGATIRCNALNRYVCRKTPGVSDAYSVAEGVMEASIDPGEQETFGLCYGSACPSDGRVSLVSDFTSGSRNNAIKVFNFPVQSSYPCFVNGISNDVYELGGKLVCWALDEGGLYTPQKESGVITRSRASLEYVPLPGCKVESIFLPCLQADLRVAAAARLDQPQAQKNY